MSDERLLHDLARLAREQAQDDPGPEWERLASGDLSPEEVEALRREAARSPEAAAAWEAFQPLDEDFRASLVGRVRDELASPVSPPAPEARVLPFRRRVPAWLRRGALPALAAAILLVALWPAGGPEALPDYELRLGGTLRSERSAAEAPSPVEGEPVPFAAGNRFEVLLTPATSAGPDVEARVLVSRAAGFEPLALPSPAISGDGALRIAGVVGDDVRLPAGEATLLVVVGRAGALPAGPELEARLARDGRVRTPLWSAWRLRVIAAP